MAERSKLSNIAVAALVAALAALNLYQYFAGTAALSELGKVSDRKAIDRYHELFYKSDGAYWKNQWLGVSTLQNPNDVWITQEIITDVKPDFLVETGTYHGGSAALWAMVLDQVNPGGRVITIDIEDKIAAARDLPIFQQKVDFLLGSSTAPEIIDEVKRRVQDKTVMVLLDSNHTKEHVLKELELYSPLVPVGSYIVVQDTNVNGHPIYPKGFSGPGPWEAVQEFLASDDHFQSDRSRERLLFTMHPRGYLKRVK